VHAHAVALGQHLGVDRAGVEAPAQELRELQGAAS
jgi:hypothetical protein